ncbi:MAG: site-specific integrase [Bacteroidales bacterium]|nr:site-specific integrase [Bacteroidales bacterium]
MLIKVHIRKKPISGNRQSLYLDFYPPIPHPETDKPTRREFLKLYLYNEIEIEEKKYLDINGKELKRFVPILDQNGKPKKIKLSPIEKLHNTGMRSIAEQIRNKREMEINKPEIYSGYEKEQLKIKELGQKNFVEFFKKLADERKASNHDNWVSAYKYLEAFTKGKLTFAELNEKFCNDFKDYLLTIKSNKSSKVCLSQNTAFSYFNKLKAALKQAYRDGYLQIDLNARVDRLKEAETQRNFLTLEELNSLVETECENPVLKKAALFSALTGLRFSDIEKLRWVNVESIRDNGYFIRFVQQKTKGAETMPISDQAFSLMGERGQPDEKVFKDLTYSAYANKHLAKWIGLAGITKEITFHCFRHTYATLQISNGTDIFTVSKMLGHRSIKTTQIYAKVIDQAKRDASNKIKLKF